jgi:RNA polymerase sigma factor (sigma-70 family)
MKAASAIQTMAPAMVTEQDQRISEVLEKENRRLRNFIRRRVSDARDAEDILQDVFYELVQAYRAAETIEEAGAWLFRVARNKITDLFRKKRPSSLEGGGRSTSEEDESLGWEELFPSADGGPEELLLQSALAEELEAALAELPAEQQQVFIAHEMEGRSFKELAEETGVSINTLLSRKRYAVLHLRKRLQSVYEEFRK